MSVNNNHTHNQVISVTKGKTFLEKVGVCDSNISPTSKVNENKNKKIGGDIKIPPDQKKRNNTKTKNRGWQKAYPHPKKRNNKKTENKTNM